MTGQQPSRRSRCSVGACVTVDITATGVTVGDTKTGDTLWFDHAEWTVFLAGVRSGEFDLDAPVDP